MLQKETSRSRSATRVLGIAALSAACLAPNLAQASEVVKLARLVITGKRASTEAAYSTPSRTPFRSDGGQHSAVMADTVPH